MKFDKKRFFITILIVLIPAFFIFSKKVEATPYAVLINGGHNTSSNNIAFWNDLSAIYTTLVNNYGYQDENIYVLNSDGTNTNNDRNTVINPWADRSDWTYSYSNSPLDLDNDGDNDIHYAATYSALSTVFSTLASTMTPNDGLFVFVTDHGGSDGGTETNLAMWNSIIDDDVFASLVDLISDYAYEIFSFQQCYSGGFIDELSGENRVIMTATDYDKSAYYWVNDYSEYNHELTNALSGLGDYNEDGYVSMLEAYNYVLANDDFALGYDSDGDDVPDTWEYPQFDDPSGIGRYLTLTGIIPEPTTMLLLASLATGLFGFAGLRKRFKR